LKLEHVLLLRRTGKVSATISIRALERNALQHDSLVSDIVDRVIVSDFNEEDWVFLRLDEDSDSELTYPFSD
jgi:hypothetical protein